MNHRPRPRFTLRQLEVFLAIAHDGTTISAAQSLALSQSATSAALRELESAIGVRLFDRIGKSLSLNDAGRALLPQARGLLDGAMSLDTQFTGDAIPPTLRLHIGASTTIGNYVLPPLIASFLALHPTSRIALRIGNTHDVSTSVVNLEVDLGFIEGPNHQEDVKTLPWMEDELVIVASPRHPLARRSLKGRVSTELLANAEWLLREPGSGTREAVEQALLPHISHLRSSSELGSAESIKLAATEGMGLACLSMRVVADFAAGGRLQILRTTLPPLRRMLSMIIHRQKFVSPALERFMGHCRRPSSKRRRRSSDL